MLQKLAWEVWEHFPFTNGGQINNVSVEGAALHMKVSWLSSPSSKEGEGGKMIALQAVKCMLLSGALCGRCATFLLNPLADGLDRLQASTQMHAQRVNTTNCAQ